MNIHRLGILLLSAAVLSGLFVLGYLISGYSSSSRAPAGTLFQHIQAAPLAWSYALASSALSLSFLMWLPWQLPVWRLRPAFRQLDSAAVDNDPTLSRRFFSEALAFRLQYGERRFSRQVIARFDFFFDFHNSALHWLNEIVNRSEAASVPTEFILSSICAGQIGRIYSGISYGSGLANTMIADNAPVFIHARMDSVEIWSATSHTPLATLQRQPLSLEHIQSYSGFVSAYLIGVDKATGNPRHLELRCQASSSDRHPDGAAHAEQHMQAFCAWIESLSGGVKQQTERHNFGIDVAEIQEPSEEFMPNPATTDLTQQLQALLGSHIDGFFARASLELVAPNIDVDAVVLCGGVGVISVTEIPLSGTFCYSGDPDWTRIDTSSVRQFDNACMKAQRAKAALANLMSSYSLTQWPVLGLVVFSHPEVVLDLVVGQQRPQCDVVTLAQLPNWLMTKASDDTPRFTKDDYNRFIALLDPSRASPIPAVPALPDRRQFITKL